MNLVFCFTQETLSSEHRRAATGRVFILTSQNKRKLRSLGGLGYTESEQRPLPFSISPLAENSSEKERGEKKREAEESRGEAQAEQRHRESKM